MKFTLSFKTPDVLENAITEACADLEEEAALDLEGEMQDTVRSYVKYGECISVEFDTETSIAKVLRTR